MLANETADSANHKQLSISICWVDKDYNINENFIALMHVPRITSDVLTNAITDILVWCALPLTQCRRQWYNGASNMMGNLNGVCDTDSGTRSNCQLVSIVWHIAL